MKLNKNGTTLVELVVSIALLSIVMIFMFRLLVDVNNDKYNNDFAEDNQIIRAEIIKTIEEDLKTKNLDNVYKKGDNQIIFHFGPNSTDFYSLIKNGNILTFNGSRTKKWTMKSCQLGEIHENLFGSDNSYKIVNSDNEIVSFMINIEVYTNNDNNSRIEYKNRDDISPDVENNFWFTKKNNLIDDITINYFNRYVSL